MQAGLGFAVSKRKTSSVVTPSNAGSAEDRPHIACLLLEDPRSMVLGNEPVFADERVVSRVTSGGVGYHVGRSIALAYLPEDLDPAMSLTVDVFGERVPAQLATMTLYDPNGERIRA